MIFLSGGCGAAADSAGRSSWASWSSNWAGNDENTATPVATVQSRDHSVKVYATDRYTVEDVDGRVVAEWLTADEFEQLMPEVFADTREALATSAWQAGDDWSDRDDWTYDQIQSNWTTTDQDWAEDDQNWADDSERFAGEDLSWAGDR
jgi:hypothetical protein